MDTREHPIFKRMQRFEASNRRLEVNTGRAIVERPPVMIDYQYVEAHIPFVGEFGDVPTLYGMSEDDLHEHTRRVQRTIAERLAQQVFCGETPSIIFAGVMHYPQDYQLMILGFKTKRAAVHCKLVYGGEA